MRMLSALSLAVKAPSKKPKTRLGSSDDTLPFSESESKAHNPEVVVSNPTPATNFALDAPRKCAARFRSGFLAIGRFRSCFREMAVFLCSCFPRLLLLSYTLCRVLGHLGAPLTSRMHHCQAPRPHWRGGHLRCAEPVPIASPNPRRKLDLSERLPLTY